MKKHLLIISAASLGLLGTAVAAQIAAPMAAKTITRAEAEAKAKEHFAKMDANNDGKLDKADREARQIEHFKKLDTDSNGSISQSEFLAAHQGMGKGMDMNHGGGDGPMAGGPGMKHEGHDMSKGGMRHAGKRGMGDRMGGNMGGMMMLHMADTNKDGAISRDEFVGSALKHFDMADTNKDGSVTPDERKAAMQKMHEHMKQMRGKMGAMQHGAPPPPEAK